MEIQIVFYNSNYMQIGFTVSLSEHSMIQKENWKKLKVLGKYKGCFFTGNG